MARRQSQLQNTKHKYVLDRLSSYVDEQLPADERARVEAHLRACHSCRDDLRTLRWTHDLLQQVAPVPVPRSFVLREADVARPKQTWPGRRPLAALQWATALVAILLALVVTGDLWTGAWRAPGKEPPAISIVSMQETTDQVIATPESEVIITNPKQGEIEAGSTRAQDAITEPEAKVSEDAESPASPAEGMEASGTPANTLTGVAVPAEEASIAKESVATTGPVFEGETKEKRESQPIFQSADGVSAATQSPLIRTGWLVAKIGLSVLLAGLIVAVVWLRRRKQI